LRFNGNLVSGHAAAHRLPLEMVDGPPHSYDNQRDEDREQGRRSRLRSTRRQPLDQMI